MCVGGGVVSAFVGRGPIQATGLINDSLKHCTTRMISKDDEKLGESETLVYIFNITILSNILKSISFRSFSPSVTFIKEATG